MLKVMLTGMAFAMLLTGLAPAMAASCGRHSPENAICSSDPYFTADLGPKNGVPAQTYQFYKHPPLDANKGDTITGSYTNIMTTACAVVGMKPVCNHHGCKDNTGSLYIGQDDNVYISGQRNSLELFPSGWAAIKDEWYGVCVFEVYNNYAMCPRWNNGIGSWSELAIGEAHEANYGFICAKVIQSTSNPSPGPTTNPSPGPTTNPSPGPTTNPSPGPTTNPSPGPTGNPTPGPTTNPSPGPTGNPTPGPTSQLDRLEGAISTLSVMVRGELSEIKGLLNHRDQAPSCYGRRTQA